MSNNCLAKNVAKLHHYIHLISLDNIKKYIRQQFSELICFNVSLKSRKNSLIIHKQHDYTRFIHIFMSKSFENQDRLKIFILLERNKTSSNKHLLYHSMEP